MWRLRNRLEDLEKHIDTYLKLYCDMYSRYHVLTAGAKKILMEYPWYGNLIQLESFAVIISEMLEKHGGNRALVAQELGFSKTTLWRHMKKYGISNKYMLH